jgi:hypothetical protein
MLIQMTSILLKYNEQLMYITTIVTHHSEGLLIHLYNQRGYKMFRIFIWILNNTLRMCQSLDY